jgi:hypothetical protein
MLKVTCIWTTQNISGVHIENYEKKNAAHAGYYNVRNCYHSIKVP